MSKENHNGKWRASEEMLDKLQRRDAELGGTLARKAIAFVLHTGWRIDAGDREMGDDRDWADEAMRAYVEAEEIYEKE